MIYFADGCVAIQILCVIVVPCDHETDVDICLNLPMFRHECVFSDMNVFIEPVCNHTQFVTLSGIGRVLPAQVR